MAFDPVPSNKVDVSWPPLAVFRTTVRDWTRLRKFQVKFRDMLTLEPEDCCASGLDKILGDSGRAPDMLFPHISPTHSIYIKTLFLHKECSTMKYGSSESESFAVFGFNCTTPQESAGKRGCMNIYIYTHINIHIHIYTYIYIVIIHCIYNRCILYIIYSIYIYYIMIYYVYIL